MDSNSTSCKLSCLNFEVLAQDLSIDAAGIVVMLVSINCSLSRYRRRFVPFQTVYRGTSLTRKCTPLGPYRRPMPTVLGWSKGGWAFS